MRGISRSPRNGNFADSNRAATACAMRLAAPAAFAAHDLVDVLAERLERSEPLVLVARRALLEQRVLLHGHAHQPDDHVAPVRGLAALVPDLRLAQLGDRAPDRRHLRKASSRRRRRRARPR